MKVEVGKTYLTRTGERVHIHAKTGWPGTYRMRGEDNRGRITWRSERGRFVSYPHSLDLVAEVTD